MQEIVGAAECVLFDFDGPICDLFAGNPSPGIAQRLRDLLLERNEKSLLTTELRTTDDPQVILQALARQPDGTLAALVAETLTREEITATSSAMPTPYADPLIWTLVATGRRVAVTTNNSELAAEQYLTSRRLAPYFAGHIHGRGSDTRLLKPHPDCLLRALKSTRTSADQALMIGDTPADLAAARDAGVPFLGYARNARKAALLGEAGAEHIVRSLQEVLAVINPYTLG